MAGDLTSINVITKKELPMGTGYDNFSDTAHHACTSLSKVMLLNRLKLKSIMEKNGLKAFDTEWWHYSWPEPTKYELLDISFEELKRLLINKFNYSCIFISAME